MDAFPQNINTKQASSQSWRGVLASKVENTRLGKWLKIKSGRTSFIERLQQLSKEQHISYSVKRLAGRLIQDLADHTLLLSNEESTIYDINAHLRTLTPATQNDYLEKALSSLILDYWPEAARTCHDKIQHVGNLNPSKKTHAILTRLEQEVNLFERESMGIKDKFGSHGLSMVAKGKLLDEQSILNKKLANTVKVLNAIDKAFEVSNDGPNEVFEKSLGLLIELKTLKATICLQSSKEHINQLFNTLLKLVDDADPFDEKSINDIASKIKDYREQMTALFMQDQSHQSKVEHALALIESIRIQLNTFIDGEQFREAEKECALQLKQDFEAFDHSFTTTYIQESEDSLRELEEKLKDYTASLETVRFEIRYSALLHQLEKIKAGVSLSPASLSFIQESLGKLSDKNNVLIDDIHEIEKSLKVILADKNSASNKANQLLGKVEILLHHSQEDSTQAALKKNMEELKVIGNHDETEQSKQRLKEIERIIVGLEQGIMPFRTVE